MNDKTKKKIKIVVLSVTGVTLVYGLMYYSYVAGLITARLEEEELDRLANDLHEGLMEDYFKDDILRPIYYNQK